MASYRKKPVVIEAWRLGSEEPRPDWVKFDFGNGHDYGIVRTLEGEMRAERGDWIIKGVKGELYPCKPDIFAATYDEVVTKIENPTIADLEKLLSEPDTKVNIHPDGSVTRAAR